MMMAPDYYVFTGRDGEVIPRHVTHVLIAKALKFVPARAFAGYSNIQEVICHDGVLKVDEEAFFVCPSLRRVIMPGVKEVEQMAFCLCKALAYVECGKLERIGEMAFEYCKSLSSFDCPSIRIVDRSAFEGCLNLTSVNFGKELESIGGGAFYGCDSLERITLPLKNGMITHDNSFQRCENLYHVDLVGGVHETIATLLLEEWKNDMNEEIDSINQILPNTHAGTSRDVGGKAQAIRMWIGSVLRKIIHYKAEHYRYLNEAAAILQPTLPNDIVLKNVLPFVELPAYSFDGED